MIIVGIMTIIMPAASRCHDPCCALAKFIRKVVRVLREFFGIYKYGIYMSLIIVIALIMTTVAVAGAAAGR